MFPFPPMREQMATYAIGDIHGCFETLQRLLDRIDYDRASDRLWFVGDLVNGGPDSLGVLRWVRERTDDVVTVLGNHDLHMLAVAAGEAPERPNDTFRPVLEAADADDLLDWLRRRPMLHRRDGAVLLHAGLFPSWTVERAEQLAAEVEEALRRRGPAELFADMYGNRPRTWSDEFEGIDRIRVIVNALTRMRSLQKEDRGIDFDYKQQLEGVPEHLEPWFAVDDAEWEGARMVFGHWSAIGYHRSGTVHALDSGCVWGDSLTALRLEDEALFQVDSELPEVFD